MEKPVEQTLEYLRGMAYIAVALPAGAVRFADVLAWHAQQQQFLLVQAVPRRRLVSCLAQAVREPELAAWLKAGGSFELFGWGPGRWASADDPRSRSEPDRRSIRLGDLPVLPAWGTVEDPDLAEADDDDDG